MDNRKLIKLNNMINQAYECFSFSEFLKLTILKLHELVMYDSGMFFCGISKDCSFFKPYVGGKVEEYYSKQNFDGMSEYLSQNESGAGKEAQVYKALDYTTGIVQIGHEPRSEFLMSQENFHIVCIRIINKGQFLGEIYLHREKDRPDFNDEDLFLLKLLQPHVSTVFGIIHTVTAVKIIESDNPMMSKKGMCILDGELNLTGGNITGLEMLKYSTIYGSSILYHIKEICEDLMNGRGSAAMLYQTETYKTNGDDLRIEIYYHEDKRYKKNTQSIIIMEFINTEHKLSDYKYKFTKREADIIDGIVQGKNNAQLAGALNLSENTIKTHIKKIYLKVGANNRTELTYILMINKG